MGLLQTLWQGHRRAGCGGWVPCMTSLVSGGFPQNQEDRLTARNFHCGLSSTLGPVTPEAPLGKGKAKLHNAKHGEHSSFQILT